MQHVDTPRDIHRTRASETVRELLVARCLSLSGSSSLGMANAQSITVLLNFKTSEMTVAARQKLFESRSTSRGCPPVRFSHDRGRGPADEGEGERSAL